MFLIHFYYKYRIIQNDSLLMYPYSCNYILLVIVTIGGKCSYSKYL